MKKVCPRSSSAVNNKQLQRCRLSIRVAEALLKTAVTRVDAGDVQGATTKILKAVAALMRSLEALLEKSR